MDGGQVGLTADGKTQASAWMSDEGGKRRLFFFMGKPGEAPRESPPVKIDGQQTHPSVAVVSKDRVVVAYERDGGRVHATLIARNGDIEKTFSLGRGMYPRAIAAGDGVIVAYETDAGIQVHRISAAELNPAAGAKPPG